MKLNFIKVVLVALAMLAGLFAYRYYRNTHDPLIAGVPPHENPDGTIDYTLIEKPALEYPGDYWVIRLPKAAYIAVSEEGTAGSVFNSAGQGVSLATKRNESVDILFRLPNLELIETKNKKPNEGFANVLLVSARNDGDDIWKTILQDAQKNESGCKSVSEIAPGVVAYKASVLPGQMPKSDDLCRVLNAPGEPFTYYNIKHQDGDVFAILTCSASDGNPIGSCSGQVVLPSHRGLYIHFLMTQLSPEKFRDAMEFLVTFFAQATVETGKIPANQVYEPKP